MSAENIWKKCSAFTIGRHTSISVLGLEKINTMGLVLLFDDPMQLK
jgi:hypothetical protein